MINLMSAHGIGCKKASIMLGTKIYDGTVYAYVTVMKDSSTKEALQYADGYIDADTFQWETVANVSDNPSAMLSRWNTSRAPRKQTVPTCSAFQWRQQHPRISISTLSFHKGVPA